MGGASAAGVSTPTVTTGDVLAGADIKTAQEDFPGLSALFRETALLGAENAALDASEQALIRQREFARQTRDATTMMDADAKLALVQARRSVMGYIEAGNAAMTGNFEPMAAALSQMSGQDVKITPTGTGVYTVSVDGKVAQEGLDGQSMVQQYMYGVNEAYRAEVEAARAAAASAATEKMKAGFEQAKIILEQEMQAQREVTVEQAKAYIEAQVGANPEFYTQSITGADGSTSVLLYDRKNPNTPMSVITMQTREDGTVESVQSDVYNTRRQ